MDPITGTAAGVPFTALPPADPNGARLLVGWHMLDAPRSNAAFAAALPMHGIPAWRVYLGMPMCGARMVDGTMAAVFARAEQDALRSYVAMMVDTAADEFPPALAALRDQLPIGDGPVDLFGGSMGGAVTLMTLARAEIPVRRAALVNPAIRARTVIALIEEFTGPYPWDGETEALADRLDFVARAAEIAGRAPLLILSGELDEPGMRADAQDLMSALRTRDATAELTTVPELAHPLADEPGIEPAPQLPVAKSVDDLLTAWFTA
ncbi:alpha/beta hydrolase family protein [Nocardia sp. NPDC052566]|uniref:alpha/beta hydrolase family protein n=1 Tax=Nocardia sp. NPDC052566 TaxID=3364330 RepID=UPI0037CC48F9